MLQLEHELYGDLIVMSFTESQRNSTYKYISGLKYIKQQCGDVPFILKTEDDTFVNMFELLKILENELTLSGQDCRNLALCHIELNSTPVRTENEAGFVTYSEWAADYYPPYCNGAFTLMTSDVAQELFTASIYVKYFPIDDIFVFSILANKIRVNMREIEPKTFEVTSTETFHKKKKDQSFPFFLTSSHFFQLENMWNNMTRFYTIK